VRHAAGSGTPEQANSQPDQVAQPAMATAVVDGKPALCPIDPVLNQIAACAPVTVWSMVVFPSDFDLLGHATSWAPCHVFNEHLRVDSTPKARFPR